MWAIVVALNQPERTRKTISDLLAQSEKPRVLLLAQGVDWNFRGQIESWAEEDKRILPWFHDPPLPSLSASWNRALRFCWALGEGVALVCNNDIELREDTLLWLSMTMQEEEALFVSAVGVDQVGWGDRLVEVLEEPSAMKGGPDFSCFLISQECHTKFPFDEAFIPAYTEDCDLHRRVMLAGEGQRMFSINVPYLHHASGTLKEMPEERAQAIKAMIHTVARAHYKAKWGGDVNQEKFKVPFGPEEVEGVTTAELFHAERELWTR